MSIDRRRFIQLGGMAMLAEGGCCPKLIKTVLSDPPSVEKPDRPPDVLAIDFEGLYLIEEKSSAMTVHVLDAKSVGMPEHLPQLRAFESTIDRCESDVPDQVIEAGSDKRFVWNLKGVDVTAPPSDSGSNDLTPLGDSDEDSLDIPNTADGWNSRARIADLRVCCGATQITNPKAFTSSVTLTHGRVDVLEPTNYGARTVWEFTRGQTVLMKRALSDSLRYSCPTGGRPLTVTVGTRKIVFKATGSLVEVMNMPMGRPNHCNGCSPTMKHFPAFFKAVDKAFDPKICLAAYIQSTAKDVFPDYCPGGRI